jgi:syntaxin-binding protein 5
LGRRNKRQRDQTGQGMQLISYIFLLSPRKQYQPNRILILHQFDLIVEFLDISAQLLLSDNSKPVDVDFPSIIPDLAIDLFPILSDAAVVKATSPDFVNRARISSVCLAVESLECAVILQSGELVVYRLGPQQLAAYRESPDKELIMLQHLPGLPDRRYHPYFALIPGRGQVTACRFSDIGAL